jgi:hypothetical protein
LEEEGQWGDHEIDGKMSHTGMQPTCCGFGAGRLQQEIGRSGGRSGEAMARKRSEEEDYDDNDDEEDYTATQTFRVLSN